MIEVNGKVYRNLQEQVYENTIDIDELKRMYGYRGPYESTADIENPVDLGLYLIGTEAPYAIYQYHELTQNYTDLGLFNQRGPQGEQGLQGPQGETGAKGDPVTITVNDEVYHSYMGNINLPDYPHDGVWGSIVGTLSNQTDLQAALDSKQNVITDLDEIRTGAALGATAVQPAELDNYYDKEEIDNKLDLKADADDIPTKVSELENDENYVTAEALGTDYVTTNTNQNIYATKTFKLDDNENDFVQINWDKIRLYSQEPNQDYYSSTLNTTELSVLKPTLTDINNYEFQLHLKTVVNDYDTVYKFPINVNGNLGASHTVATTDMLPNMNNYVTTYTDQDITGAKYFKNENTPDFVAFIDNTRLELTDYRDSTFEDAKFNTIIAPGRITLGQRYHDNVLYIRTDDITHIENNLTTPITNTYTFDTASTGIARMSDIPDVSDFVTDTELATTLEDYELAANAFSGNYNDLTNKPDLTVYELKSEAFSGDYDDLTNKPSIPTKTSDLTNDSGFITGVTWNDVTGKPTFATVATTGDYDDLTNKPTIPVVPTNVSAFTNDAGYITSSDLPTNHVTTDTTQTITGNKTFSGTTTFSNATNKFTARNPIQLVAPSNQTTGFTLFNSSNTEKGYLQYNSSQDGLYLGRWGNSAAAELGFLSESSTNRGYKVLVPNLTSTVAPSNNVNYITLSVNNTKADSTGNISLAIPDVSNYYTKTEVDNLIPTVPTNVSSFTNDAGYITGITDTMINTALGYTAADAADVPTTASSTSTVTPTTTQLVFTYNDNTTETVTLMTGATVSTTTTLS